MQDSGIYSKRLKSLKTLIIGEFRNPFDSDIFHKVSLIALFAWVGLGSDAMSFGHMVQKKHIWHSEITFILLYL